MKNNYFYSVSNIKVAEKKMLKFNDFLNMAECKNYPDAIDYLIKTGHLKNEDREKSVETIMQERKSELVNKMRELNIEEIDLFLLEIDFYNIKAIVKCDYYNVAVEEYINNLTKNTYKYQHIIEDAKKLIKREGIQAVDAFIDNQFYNTGIKLSKDSFFAGWFKLLKTIKSADVQEENKKIRYLKKHRSDITSIAPVFAYFYGVLIELRNIRTVLQGKKVNSEKEKIIERLCMTYA